MTDKNDDYLFRAIRRRGLVFAGLGLTALPSFAQFRVEVTGVGLTQYPIAIVPFTGEASSPQKISAIVSADLERSGQFRLIPAGGVTMDETTHPDMATWRDRQADDLAAGHVTATADGRYDVRFRLWDVVRDQDLGGQGYVVARGDLRLAAHRISDYIYEKITGEKGIFSTRIAYVTSVGKRFTLWVADSDGENAQPALASPEPIISPAWSPDGTRLAYVSFESRKPVVYVQNVARGGRRLIANFKGSNSAPAWSPDGRTLAVTLSRDGGSQIFLISSSGGEPRRITQSQSIDTEPAFSADGAYIYFTSDRSGGPQIYRMSSSGGGATRITFSGNYNVSPAISPDGRWLAYITRSGGLRLQVMELASGNVASITDTTNDEHPSFAPNSRLILYASNERSLVTTTLDGKIKARLAVQSGSVHQPVWGPYQK